MKKFHLSAAGAAILFLCSSVPAEDLGGGMAASHGRVPRLVLEHWIPGTPSAFRFLDLPSGTVFPFVMLGDRSTNIPFAGTGNLVVDPLRPCFQVFPIPRTGLSIPRLPVELNGLSLVFQGVYLESKASGFRFTDGTKADFFKPRVMVGGQGISEIDILGRSVIRNFGKGIYAGGIVYSPDRSRAYVTNLTGNGGKLYIYDLTKGGALLLKTLRLSSDLARYMGTVTRDGRRLYVPARAGIVVVDTDPKSPKYHTELFIIPVSTGHVPTALAVTPDGRKLYVAYNHLLSKPANPHIGMIDLTKPGTPETMINLTLGGSFLGISTRYTLEMSFDGSTVYTVEWGVHSVGTGFKNGAMISVIDTKTDREIAAIPTDGFSQKKLAVDRMNRNLWVAQLAKNGIGYALRVDVDRRSATRFKKKTLIMIDPKPYHVYYGPRGIGVTPDGARVVVSCVQEPKVHPTPQAFFIDALTNKLVGKPVNVVGGCHTISIQQM